MSLCKRRRHLARALVLALLALTLCLISSLGWGKGPGKQLQRIELLLEQWQISEAESVLAPLLVSAPDHAGVIQLRAEILFLRGEYQQALEVLQPALRKNGSAGRARALHRLITSTLVVVRGYVAYRSAAGRFQIWTPPGKDQILAPFAAEALEAMHDQIKESLGYGLSDVIRVEIVPRVEDLAGVSPLTIGDIHRSGTIALCKYNRMIIVSPKALARGYAWLDTLAHEYTHLVVSRMTRNSAPIWLHEGLSKLFETSWRTQAGTPAPLSPTQEHLLMEAFTRGRLIRWEEMHPSMAKLPSQQATALAFAQVQTAVELIAKLGGMDGLRKLISALRDGRTDWQAVQLATKLSKDQFSTAWKKHLRSLNLRRLTGLVPQELQFGRKPSQEQRIAAIKESRARRHLRLAEMLRTRGLTRAGIVEYQRARVYLGPRDDLVANHLARAYLEISSPEQAVSALLPVLEFYPEISGPQVTMGVAYLRSGDTPSAERHLKAALRINPFDPEIHCGLAQALKERAPREAARYAALCKELS